MEVKQQAEDRYDLLNGILVFCAGMAGNDDHTRPASERCALVNRF